jgi:hypothetical protein
MVMRQARLAMIGLSGSVVPRAQGLLALSNAVKADTLRPAARAQSLFAPTNDFGTRNIDMADQRARDFSTSRALARDLWRPGYRNHIM